MHETAANFEFCDDPATYAEAAVAGSMPASVLPIVVRLPAGLRSKRKLLGEYVRQLSLPDYFGWNWDALDECLRDLAWHDHDRPIVIVHAGLPFRGHRQSRQAYLQLLRDVANFWTDHRGRRFQVVFPRAAEPVIATILSRPAI